MKQKMKIQKRLKIWWQLRKHVLSLSEKHFKFSASLGFLCVTFPLNFLMKLSLPNPQTDTAAYTHVLFTLVVQFI